MDETGGRTAVAVACLNCGAALEGRFCGFCGQDVEAVVKPLRSFVAESVGEVFSLDGPVVRSFRTLLVRPGRLTVEYLAGRRARFVRPMKLFVQTGITGYLLALLIPTSWPLFGIGPELFGGGATVGELLAAVGILPLAVGAHWLALRGRRPLVLEHAVFITHLTAFSFLLAPVEGLLYFVARGHPVLDVAAALVAPMVMMGYWLVALARFVDRPVRAALLDGLRVYGFVLLLMLPLLVFAPL